MKNIVEIRLHGRGGQGTVTAAELLAVAAFYTGKQTQAFPSFGVERRGAPVKAFCRISDQFIRNREQIYTPEYLIIQDSSLIKSDPSIMVGLENCSGILINTEQENWPEFKGKKVITIPATKIAIEKIGKPFINTALLGAFAGMCGLCSMDALKRAIEERFPAELAQKNIEAMKQAYTYTNNRKE